MNTSDNQSEAEIQPVPGDVFKFSNISEAGDTEWQLITMVSSDVDNDESPDMYVFRAIDDPTHVLQLSIEAVGDAIESEHVEYTSRREDFGVDDKIKGTKIFGLAAGQSIHSVQQSGVQRDGTITDVDEDADTVTVHWNSGETEMLSFQDDGLLPEGYMNLVTGTSSQASTASTATTASTASTATTASSENASPTETEEDTNEEKSVEVLNDEGAVVANSVDDETDEIDVAKSVADALVAVKAGDEEQGLGFIEIEVIEELDAALRTYTEEEQEQDFLEDWIQRPLAGHSKRLLSSRFALTDMFTMFRTLMRERIDDDSRPDATVRISNPQTRPFPLYPLSETTVNVYTSGTEAPNVRGLHGNGKTNAAVEQFVDKLLPENSTEPLDVMMSEMFAATQPWTSGPAGSDEVDEENPLRAEVRRDMPFFRISDADSLTNVSNDMGTTTHPLHVGAWKEEVHQEGTVRIRVFHGHQIYASGQRAVAGFIRIQPESEATVSAIPADTLQTDGYMYVPYLATGRDWIDPRPSKVLLFDVRRSRPHLAPTDSTILFSGGAPATVPVLTSQSDAESMDLRRPALFRAELALHLPPLDKYIESVIGSSGPDANPPLVMGWDDVAAILRYVGHDPQSLPLKAHAVVSSAIARSRETWIAHSDALAAASDAAIKSIRNAHAPNGMASTLCLLAYANPLDESIRAALPPELFNIPHWGFFADRTAEEWVRAGMDTTLERYWTARIVGDNKGATLALADAAFPARRVTQRIAARIQAARELGHPRAEHNPCPHIPFSDFLNTSMKDDPQGTLGPIRKLLDRYRGRRDNNWVYCFQCKRQLVCAHELLLLEAFERPDDSDIINKEIVLRFGQHGVEGKRHMCGNCGKPWKIIQDETDPTGAGGHGEAEEGAAGGNAVDLDDPDDDWAALAGYDGEFTEEADVAPGADDVAPGDEEAAAIEAAMADVTDNAKFLEETKSPLAKHPVAYRMLRDIADVAGINLTFDAETALAEMSYTFPRRPAMRSRDQKTAETITIRYLSRFAAHLVVLSRVNPGLLPVRIGAVTGPADGTEELDRDVSERSLARALASATLKHEPWRRLTVLSSKEAKARKDRADLFFAQIRKTVHSLTSDKSECAPGDTGCGEEVATAIQAAAIEIAGKFRVTAMFRPRLQYAPQPKVRGSANIANNNENTGNNESNENNAGAIVVDTTVAPGSSIITYYNAIEAVFSALATEAQKGSGIPEQFGIHYTPGIQVDHAMHFIQALAPVPKDTGKSDIAGLPEYILAAGAKYDNAFNDLWKRSMWHVPIKVFNVDAVPDLALTENDWAILFAKVCATGTNEGGHHRFLRSGHCVYCGIPTPTETEPVAVPSIAAGQKLLDSIRLRNAIAATRGGTMPDSVIRTALRDTLTRLFPVGAFESNAVAALLIALHSTSKELVGENLRKMVIKSLEWLYKETATMSKLIPRADVLKGMARNPYALCRDVLQFLALPLARWVSADATTLKKLRTVPPSYDLYNEHRRDIETFLEGHVGRMPKLAGGAKPSPQLLAAATDSAKRLRAMCQLREVWSTGIAQRMRARDIGDSIEVDHVVQTMMTYALYNALWPIVDAVNNSKDATVRRDKAAVVDFMGTCITAWTDWERRVNLSAVEGILLRYTETEKDMLLREYESNDETNKQVLNVQKKYGLGRYAAGDVKRMDRAVYQRDRDLQKRIENQIVGAPAR